MRRVTDPVFLSVEHDRFRRVQRDVFTRRVVADCMTHACQQVADDGTRFDVTIPEFTLSMPRVLH